MTAERDTQARIEALERRIALLEARMGRWAENGLGIADEESVFAGYDGAFGTSPRVARHGHTH